MALDESALPELLDALRAGDGVDLIRDAVRLVMQELIELEVTDHIGAGRYERADTRINERNGHRPRLLATQAGDIELKIPKLSHGSFFPSLLSPRRRIDQALHAVIMQAYVEGVSTRSVDDLVQALGIDSGISKSQVSRICAKLDVEVDAFRNRSLAHTEFPYVYLDATYIKARDTDLHQVVSRAVVIATGITAGGDREVLGLAVGDSEAETFWTEFLRSLRRRGLGGVRLVISDSSIVTIDRLTWVAVPMVSRMLSMAALMRTRWSCTSRKYSWLFAHTAGTRPPCSLPATSSSGATAWRSTMARRLSAYWRWMFERAAPGSKIWLSISSSSVSSSSSSGK